ncbi:MAG: HNH endonuclease [Chloroflexi bacterium]|nr:HNH endonuclease [Chloroflexota bacterium]
MSRISRKLRSRIAAQARYRCGYCQTQEIVSGIPLTVEHIKPIAHGGSDNEENIWLSCRLCNETKGTLEKFLDAKTGKVVPLFNPRTQLWGEHFTWDETAVIIAGKTAVGRATVAALSLNSELRVRSRAIWVEAGWHPPSGFDKKDEL